MDLEDIGRRLAEKKPVNSFERGAYEEALRAGVLKQDARGPITGYKTVEYGVNVPKSGFTVRSKQVPIYGGMAQAAASQSSSGQGSGGGSGTGGSGGGPGSGGDGGGSGSSSAAEDIFRGMTGAELEDYIDTREHGQQLDVLGLQNKGALDIQNLISESNRYIADAQKASSMYESDKSVERQQISSGAYERTGKYVADVKKQQAENVATIQGKYGLDLQKIVNAGAKDVEDIRGKYGVEAEKTKGEFGLKSDILTTKSAERVAGTKRDATMFGSLLSGFWG